MKITELTPIPSRRSSRRAPARVFSAPAGWASGAARRSYSRIRGQQSRTDDLVRWREPKTILVIAGAGAAVVVVGAGAMRVRSRRHGADGDSATDVSQQAIDQPGEELGSEMTDGEPDPQAASSDPTSGGTPEADGAQSA
jgi:hypothetical protein